MCSFHLEVACPSKRTWDKTYISHGLFGIIIKYYSQGLKPLGSTLSPSSPKISLQIARSFPKFQAINYGKCASSLVWRSISQKG
jgi:hypothetical protein